MKQQYELEVNGEPRQVASHPDTSLLNVLRNDLGLTGARFGCGQALCGACFVLVDGQVVPACDTPLWSVDGKRVVTVEGLAPGESLHRIQTAVLDNQAAQCGYCISGIVVNAAALLEEDPAPDAETVSRALDRNLCRCGVHKRVVAAVVAAGAAGSDR